MDNVYNEKRLQSLEIPKLKYHDNRLAKVMKAAYRGQISKEAFDMAYEKTLAFLFKMTVQAGIYCNSRGDKRIKKEDMVIAAAAVIKAESSKF